YNSKNQKLISYTDNIPPVIHHVPQGPYVRVPFTSTVIPAESSDSDHPFAPIPSLLPRNRFN
ncbi:hypothetical protein NPIL_41531, partial [Nephila pilipes]